MIVSKHFRITTNGTTVLYSQGIVLAQLVFLVTNNGTTWVGTIRDHAASPAIIFGPETLTIPSTGLPTVVPFMVPGIDSGGLPMFGGLDFFSTGTAGVIDIWTSIHQPSTNA